MTEERLETWYTAVERTQLTGAVLKAGIKAFVDGGAGSRKQVELAFLAVEAARESWRESVAIEGRAYASLGKIEEPAQQEIPTDADGPRGLVEGQKALPPAAEV